MMLSLAMALLVLLVVLCRPESQMVQNDIYLDRPYRYRDVIISTYNTPPPGRFLKKNDTLVVVLGSLRGGEKAWESLYRNVLDVNSADLALVIGQVPASNKTSSMYRRARYIWEFPEYQDWGEAVDLIGVSQDGSNFSWRDIAKKTAGESAIFGGTKIAPSGSGAINYMARWFLSKKIQELGLTEHYQRFVISRADHYFVCEHDLSKLDPSSIWLPEGEDWMGLEDRHFVCSNDTILSALDILPPLVHHPKHYLSADYADIITTQLNPELLTWLRWKEMGLLPKVRRFPRTMLLVATQHDSSRWSVPKQWFLDPALHGLGVKYMSEYQALEPSCVLEAAQERQLSFYLVHDDTDRIQEELDMLEKGLALSAAKFISAELEPTRLQRWAEMHRKNLNATRQRLKAYFRMSSLPKEVDRISQNSVSRSHQGLGPDRD